MHPRFRWSTSRELALTGENDAQLFPAQTRLLAKAANALTSAPELVGGSQATAV